MLISGHIQQAAHKATGWGTPCAGQLCPGPSSARASHLPGFLLLRPSHRRPQQSPGLRALSWSFCPPARPPLLNRLSATEPDTAGPAPGPWVELWPGRISCLGQPARLVLHWPRPLRHHTVPGAPSPAGTPGCGKSGAPGKPQQGLGGAQKTLPGQRW